MGKQVFPTVKKFNWLVTTLRSKVEKERPINPHVVELAHVALVTASPERSKEQSSLGGLEPPTFRLTAERANRLRHRDTAGV